MANSWVYDVNIHQEAYKLGSCEIVQPITSHAENHGTSPHEARSTRRIVKFRFCAEPARGIVTRPRSVVHHTSWGEQGEYTVSDIYQAFGIYIYNENI